MSKTRQQMVHRALTKLGHYQAGQEPQTEDYNRIDENLESIFAELSARKIFYVGDYDSYDEETFEPLADFLAGSMGDDFAKPADWQEIKKATAIERLEVIAAPSGTGEPLKADPMLRAGASYPGYTTLLDG